MDFLEKLLNWIEPDIGIGQNIWNIGEMMETHWWHSGNNSSNYFLLLQDQASAHDQ